jgi:hypothetical protein
MIRNWTFLLLGLFIIGCKDSENGGASNLSSSSEALVQSTSPESAKNILSMYGYSIEEFWKIVDKVRFDGDIMFLPSYSPMGLLLFNCEHVATMTDDYEKIELTNEYCRVDFLFERKKTVSGGIETIDVTYRMKLKNEADYEHYNIISFECVGQATGSADASNLAVDTVVDCKATDYFYGSFEATHKYQITGLEENMKIHVESLVTSSGSTQTSLLPGAAKVEYEYDFSMPENSFYIINGEKDTSYQPQWYTGIRIN